MCVREPPPSSSSRTVLRKLLELEGKSQHSWPELLPIPPTPRVEPAKPLLAVCRPSSTVSSGPPRPGLLCLNLNHEVSCGSSTTRGHQDHGYPGPALGEQDWVNSAGAEKGEAM